MPLSARGTLRRPVSAQSAPLKPIAPIEPIAAVVDAFRSHDVIGLQAGESHGDERGPAFVISVMRDPRFAAVGVDVVMENGSARYQGVIDRYTRGEEVPYSELRHVWDGKHEGEVGMSSQRVSGTAVQRTIAVLGSAVFFVVAPCTLAGLVPWSITGWQLRPPFLGLELTRGIGAIMILAGVPGLVDAFARFALQGLGTPAPIAPPRNLVVTGLYRYVRNPIYVAVVAIILGQAVLMGDWRLIVYGALWWLVFHVAVVAYEEPTLEQTFGKEYEAFRAAVPRWIPRMTPWRSK